MIEFIKSLNMLESFILTIAVLFVGRVIFREIQVLRLYSKLVKKQKKRLKELEENKCKGPHSWIYMPVNGEETNICKECYFSPKNEGFVKKEFVQAHLEELKYKEAMEEYMETRLRDIATAHGIENPKAVYDAMVSIKKDFTIQWLDKKIVEMMADKDNV